MWGGDQNLNRLTRFNSFNQQQQSQEGLIGGYPQFASNSNGYASTYGPTSGYSGASSGYGPSASGYGPTSTANGPTNYAFSPNNGVYRKASSTVYGSNPSTYQKSDHSGHSGGGHGHASYSGGGGYGKMNKCPGIPLALLLITLLGIAITGAILFLKIQAAGKRKRRSAFHWDDLPELVAIGRRIFQ